MLPWIMGILNAATGLGNVFNTQAIQNRVQGELTDWRDTLDSTMSNMYSSRPQLTYGGSPYGANFEVDSGLPTHIPSTGYYTQQMFDNMGINRGAGNYLSQFTQNQMNEVNPIMDQQRDDARQQFATDAANLRGSYDSLERGINNLYEQDRGRIDANRRADFQGREGLDMVDPQDVFKNMMQGQTMDVNRAYDASLRSGLDRFSAMGRAGIDQFDATGAGSFGFDADVQRLRDLAGARNVATRGMLDQANTNTQTLADLLGTNLQYNTGLDAALSNLAGARLGTIGDLGGQQQRALAELMGTLSSRLGATDRDQSESLRQALTQGNEFLINLPGLAENMQGARLGNAGQAIQDWYNSTVQPELANQQLLLQSILDQTNVQPDLNQIFGPFMGIGTDIEQMQYPNLDFE